MERHIEALPFLEHNEGLEAKTLFEHFQRTYPGHLSDGQLRTFQLRVKQWRATCGPGREVYFPQKHEPGRLSQSDFTHMASLQARQESLTYENYLQELVVRECEQRQLR